MCTLTYFLSDGGYELFFNRDEQRSRPLARPPVLNNQLKAIFPIDPQGMGTWIGVHNSGLSLALLNLYQATFLPDQKKILSRGQLILSLLKRSGTVEEQLLTMDLSVYRPFQVCLFPGDLSSLNPHIKNYFWDGEKLAESKGDLPITSSGVEFEKVLKKRTVHFNKMIDRKNPNRADFLAFHNSKETEGKYSVCMERPDARTVSISHITVGTDITFTYHDKILGIQQTTRCQRRQS